MQYDIDAIPVTTYNPDNYVDMGEALAAMEYAKQWQAALDAHKRFKSMSKKQQRKIFKQQDNKSLLYL